LYKLRYNKFSQILLIYAIKAHLNKKLGFRRSTARLHVSCTCLSGLAECVLAVQSRTSLSKGDDFGNNRKRVCDFLL